jgi:hypothetical protein
LVSLVISEGLMSLARRISTMSSPVALSGRPHAGRIYCSNPAPNRLAAAKNPEQVAKIRE